MWKLEAGLEETLYAAAGGMRMENELKMEEGKG
jgi:hypothetical protein